MLGLIIESCFEPKLIFEADEKTDEIDKDASFGPRGSPVREATGDPRREGRG